MLDQRDLDTQPAGNKFFAIRDAERYNDECRMRYTGAQRARAETFCDIVKMAYSARGFYINYRKTFIAVKLDAPNVRDRHMVKDIDTICEERGYVKAVSKQGIVFRLPRK